MSLQSSKTNIFGNDESGNKKVLFFVITIFIFGLIIWIIRKSSNDDKTLGSEIGAIKRDCYNFEYACENTCNSLIKNKEGKYCCINPCS